MSRADVARKIAAGAAVGGGGASVLGGMVYCLLLAEAKVAVRSIGATANVRDAPEADGLYGQAFASALSEPAILAVAGDSTAAGLGVTDAALTPGALLASGMAAVAERPVRLVNVARSGARSHDLARQTELALQELPDAVLIMIGANDITHQVRPAHSVRMLSEAVDELHAAGVSVVVATCPDLGTVKPLKQPLRYFARRWSRNLAAAQTIAVVERNARTVSLGSLLGPEFAARPQEMFGPDHFHPSAEGYGAAAMAVLPTLCAALTLWPEELPDRFRGEGVLPVAEAAAEAASSGGTEVAGTASRYLALLKHRRRRQVAPETDSTPETDSASDAGA